MSLPIHHPILEIKRRLDGSRVEFSCQGCLVKPGRHAAVLYTLDRDWHFPQVGLTVPAGSISSGFFWEGKPFNLYHWMTTAGETIGDYFNLAAETVITDSTIEWLDLVLDFCIAPGSEGIWLDEDELGADTNAGLHRQVEAGLHRQVEAAKTALRAQSSQLSIHLGRFSRSLLKHHQLE